MNTSMQVCWQCQTSLATNAWICGNCGMSYAEPALIESMDTAGELSVFPTPFYNNLTNEPRGQSDGLPLVAASPVASPQRRLKLVPLLGALFLIVALIGGGAFLLIRGSGAKSISVTRSHVATATSGIGVPVSSGNWEITLEKVHLETELSSQNIGIGSTTYTPKSGYTFLVLDVHLRNLSSAQQTQASTDMFAIINQDGQIATPDLVSFDAISGYNPGVVFSTSSGKELSQSLAFVIAQEAVGHVFKLQFRSVPLIPFSAH